MDLAEEEDPAMPLSGDGAAHQNDDVATSALWGVLVLAIAVFFVDRGFDRLFSDYRFDENITGWVSSDGLWDTIVRSWNNQGQSPLYFCHCVGVAATRRYVGGRCSHSLPCRTRRNDVAPDRHRERCGA